MKIDKGRVKKILLITLSNIGDVVLTLPVLGVLKREFPSAGITVMVGPNAKELFEADRSLSGVEIYDKRAPFGDKLRLVLRMRQNKFDMIIDLRNSLFPLLIGSRYNTSLIRAKKSGLMHRKDEHLNRLKLFGFCSDDAPFSISFTGADKSRVDNVLREFGILSSDKIAAIAPGAKSHTKRWMTSGFIKICDRLNKEMGFKVLLVGDERDKAAIKEIAAAGLKDLYDLSGRTNLRELAYLLSLCKLLVTNDSAPLHIGSSVGIPIVAIFGPSDPKKYGPLSASSAVVKKDISCSPCEKAQCAFNTLDCIRQISEGEVFDAIRAVIKK